MRSEVERRLVHAAGAWMPGVYVVGLVTYRELGLLMLVASAVTLVLEAGRLSGAIDWAFYDRLTREYEQEGLAGYALYVFSMTFVVWVFEPWAAIPGMLMLALADPISGLLGSGDLRQVKQSYVLLVMFGVCTFIASFFAPTALAALAGGVAATLADGVKPVVGGYVVDDNLTIPPAAALAITLAVRFLPPF
jgi:dolichol kinase